MREYERAVVFLLGRFWKVKGPGIIIVIPVIQSMVKVSLRTVVMDVPPQDIITKDNVTVKVNAVIYFRVVDAQKAIIEVEDYLYATSQLAQTTLRSILGQSNLDDLLSNREEINSHLQKVIDEQTEPWGVKVANVEVKNVDLPLHANSESLNVLAQSPTTLPLPKTYHPTMGRRQRRQPIIRRPHRGSRRVR